MEATILALVPMQDSICWVKELMLMMMMAMMQGQVEDATGRTTTAAAVKLMIELPCAACACWGEYG